MNTANKKESTWCVIPVYNNKDTVKSVALACRNEVQHVVVVDDGSTDVDIGSLFTNTDITVLKHEMNLGKGQAILTALRHLKDHSAEWMITVDADGQHHPEDIRKFIPLLGENPAAIIIGARRMDSPNVPASSRFGMKFSDFWVRLETGLLVRDSQSGFRAYPVAYISQLKLKANRYDFEAEVLAKAAWAGLNILSVDINVTYQEKAARVSHFRPFMDNLLHTHRHALLVSRRLMPWPHRRLLPREQNEFLLFLRHPIIFCKTLPKEYSSPSELGIAAGVGTFIAALPIFSLHTIVIVYVTTRLRMNRIMAVVIQNLCAPPFVPAVCIEIGYFIRHGSWLSEISRETLLHQAPARLWEWLIGSLILGPPLAIAIGFIIFALASSARKKAQNRNSEVRSQNSE